ncbi:unnamed protein product, partial [Boreogadus saida]
MLETVNRKLLRNETAAREDLLRRVFCCCLLRVPPDSPLRYSCEGQPFTFVLLLLCGSVALTDTLCCSPLCEIAIRVAFDVESQNTGAQVTPGQVSGATLPEFKEGRKMETPAGGPPRQEVDLTTRAESQKKLTLYSEALHAVTSNPIANFST